MKRKLRYKSFSSFVLLLAITFGSANAFSNDFETSPYSKYRDQVDLAEQNRAQALDFLNVAIRKAPKEKYKEFLMRLYIKIDDAIFRFGEERVCAGEENFGTSAYTYVVPGQKYVYFCPYYAERVTRYGENPLLLVNTILHEGTHLVGLDDECQADRVAAYVMAFNGIRIKKDQSYAIDCKAK